MFSSQIYGSENISELYIKNNTNKITFHKQQISSSQRSLLISTMHMFLNYPSEVYELIQSQSNAQKYFKLTTRPIQLEHLCSQSVQSCLTEFLQLGKKLQYIKYEAKRIYLFPNALLKSFSENVLQLTNKIQIQITDKLRVLQQQSGRLDRTMQQYNESRQNPITLLSFLKDMRQKSPLINYIVSTLNRMGLKSDPSQQDLQNTVLFLLNLYFMECDKDYCTKDARNENFIHILYSGIMREYLNICKDWFEMNQAALAMKVNFGFFVLLDQILTLDQQKIFDLNKITRKESIPELFKKSYRKVIELGKTIQFIKLYFGPQERENYKRYLDIQGIFKTLFSFLNKLAGKREEQFQFFKPKPVKYHSISNKLSTIVRPAVKINKITKDNPCNMYPEMTGMLNLRSEYTFKEKQIALKKNISMASEDHRQIDNFEETNINKAIQDLFDQILQKITSKCLQILQKQTIKSSIDRTLKGIKKIMLFEQGDFIQQLLQLSKQILEKPSQKISRNNIQRLIQQAIKTSGASRLPESIQQNISFSFRKTGQAIKGWRIFSLIYRPQKPTHCIFTTKIMSEYGQLSNMLFNFRHCEEVLSQIWANFQIRNLGPILKARNTVHQFIRAISSYLFSQIEIIWSEYLQQINKNGNIFTVLQLTQTTLQKIKSFTIQSQPLCNCHLSLIKIVDRFESIRKSLQQESQNELIDHDETFIILQQKRLKSDLNQIWSWFLGILDQSRLINNFPDTFDCRGDYSP